MRSRVVSFIISFLISFLTILSCLISILIFKEELFAEELKLKKFLNNKHWTSNIFYERGAKLFSGYADVHYQLETGSNRANIQGASQIDPFYIRLFEQAKTFYEQGKIAESIKNLEIAAFGFINHRSLLLEAYIYLVVGHYRLRNLERAAFFLSEIERLDLKQNLGQVNLRPPIYDEFLRNESLLWRLGLAALSEAQRNVLDEEKRKKVEGKIESKQGKKTQDFAGQASLVFDDSPSILEKLKKELSLSKLLAGKLPPPQATTVQEMIKVKEILHHDPRNGVASLYLAFLYEEMNNWQEAQRVLKNYLKLVPDCVAHHFELSRVLLELRKPKEALEAIKKADIFFIGDIEFHETKGQILEKLDQLEEAQMEFERARRLKIRDTQNFLNERGNFGA